MEKPYLPSTETFEAMFPLYEIFISKLKEAVEYLKTVHNLSIEDDLFKQNSNDVFSLFIDKIDDTNVTCNAYLGYKGVIYRDISISINLSVFRYIRESLDCYGGLYHIRLKNVKNELRKFRHVKVILSPYYFKENGMIRTIVKFQSYSHCYIKIPIIDVIGKTYTLPDYVKLKDASYSFKISGLLKNSTYTLERTVYYKESQTISCVLVALTDNEYDSNDIKVLRWHPAQKLQESPSPDLYELGYIARTNNAELHSYMAKEEETDLLFGEIKDGRVTILGGLELFVDGQYKNIELPIQFANHI